MESKYPGSYYQPLFDLLNNEHGIIATESEMADIITVVERLQYHNAPTGPRWVRAVDYKFKQIGHYPYRFRETPDDDYDYGEIYVTEDEGAIFFDVDNENEYIPQNDGRWLKYDILDESTPEQQSDAVDFHEWVEKNRWEYDHREEHTHTTTELYNLFKKEGK